MRRCLFCSFSAAARRCDCDARAYTLPLGYRYPDAMPRCRFFTTVLHPEVRDQELDLSGHAAEWSTKKQKLILVRTLQLRSQFLFPLTPADCLMPQTLRKLVSVFEGWNPVDPNQARAANSCAARAVDVVRASLPQRASDAHGYRQFSMCCGRPSWLDGT